MTPRFRQRTRPRRRTRLAVILLAGTLWGCGPDSDTRSEQFFAMGTLVEVTIRAADAARTERAADAARTAIEETDRRWSPRGEGELGRVNERLLAGRSAAVSPEMLAELDRARRLSRLSGGRFDPALGRLIRLWGFHSDEADPQRPPPDEAIGDLLETGAGIDRLAWNQETIEPVSGPVALDFGAYAKGLAVDRAVTALREAGIRHAIVNAGGDLRAIGDAGGRAWRVGVMHPRKNGFIAAVEARDGDSVFTSGDYERYFEYEGRRYHHILDPATGRPARGVTSVTVIHDNAAEADAAATALFVAGPGDWRGVARRMGIRDAMLVMEDGTVQLTPTMRERVELLDEAPAEPVATEPSG